MPVHLRVTQQGLSFDMFLVLEHASLSAYGCHVSRRLNSSLFHFSPHRCQCGDRWQHTLGVVYSSLSFQDGKDTEQANGDNKYTCLYQQMLTIEQ